MKQSTNKNFLEEKLIGKSELSDLQKMVEDQLALEESIGTLEEKLKRTKEVYNNVRMEQIPQFLNQFGLSEIKLADGKKITVKPDVSITIKDKEAFYKFLKKRHDDAIIKKIAELEDPTDELLEELMEKGIHFTYEQKIHGQTLKAYFRTFLEVGETPPDSVNVFTFSVTKIK